MLELVELGSAGPQAPAQLSGGQQQRVALARALINKPEVLLLDEPLGALDLKLRRSMQIEIKRIQTEVGLTFIHVTHDQEEAMTMADTVAVMNAGVIEQMGAPADLYENPRTTFVANFLGQSNLIEGRITGRAADLVTVDMHGIGVSVPTARAHADGRHGLGRHPAREGADRRRRRAARRAGQHHPRRRDQRRQLRRASARSTSSGCPGARSSRSSRRTPAGPGSSGSATRSSCPGARSTPSCSTPRRTPRPARSRKTTDGKHRGGRAGRRGRRVDVRPPARLRRLPAAAARRALAGPVLRRPVLLAARDQPLRPGRVGLPRLRDDLPLAELHRRAPGVLAAAAPRRSGTARSRRSSA